jgi:hypothetical protein
MWIKNERAIARSEDGMTEAEYLRTLDELDRLLNDPTIPLNATRVWSLLSDAAHPPPNHTDAEHDAEQTPPHPC